MPARFGQILLGPSVGTKKRWPTAAHVHENPASINRETMKFEKPHLGNRVSPT